MNTSVLSFVQTPSLLCADNVSLVIPSYQRPYVWPSEDVTGLLDQIIAAYEVGAPHYYIGTILTSVVTVPSSDSTSTTYEVIDGQQRMTTLMLLALALNVVVPGNALGRFIVVDDKPRLVFAIREEVQRLLGHWAGLEVDIESRASTEVDEAYLRHLTAARKALSDHLSALLSERDEAFMSGVADYIFTQVKWVNNIMPKGMDLNRLFSTMNNSGVQLEQSDILKSRLLGKIEKNKSRYDAIWQACENMDDYFERNLRRVFPSADWKNLENEDLAEHCAKTFPLDLTTTQAETGMSIAQLARRTSQKTNDDEKEEPQPERFQRCRSIISFSLLLMHTYRIYLHQWEEEDVDIGLNDSRLNEYFEDFVAHLNARRAQNFIKCLWQVRFQFDRWVVKWRLEEGSTLWHLRLTNVHLGKASEGGRLNRTSLESSDLSQLQSVRNFTGERSAQYWLTPFLGALIAGEANETALVQTLLESIDNQLSLADDSQKVASFDLLSGARPAMREIADVLANLKVPQGTRFEHYWFQKLEYILWRERGSFNFYDSKKLATYRVTSKNSIEHVHPQKEEFGRMMDAKHLDSFGNLVLLSPSENSSYSNQSVGKKREDFRDKGRYDSLKLAHMFNAKADRDWDGEAIKQHQAQMLELIARHYED
ncbi:DUF262 domain-containing protein [Pseudomonas moorei]|nr:DUF262 domain-containing protein [Pseudomonas moorei]